ncbi:Thioesterase/thiol ester dehydrase-isomerase [Pyrenochaeta sp. DS3sAY3a]|nr:Thioesterase/thiol ester dehydrase-isomerase [Pyrenochaeta sp. DS3sAY3a]
MKLESVHYNPTSNNPFDVRTVFSFVVPRQLCNMTGNLHGGAVALIFDITTSTAISACSKEGFWDTGHVSRSLNCTYLRPAPEGSTVYVESWVVHLGKRMGSTMGVMRVGAPDGKICYTCEHGKASVGSSSL